MVVWFVITQVPSVPMRTWAISMLALSLALNMLVLEIVEAVTAGTVLPSACSGIDTAREAATAIDEAISVIEFIFFLLG